jgi:hypothetical protein
MDYVLIAAIMTFFILLYILNIREGYTDSHINNTIESINATIGNVTKTLTNIKDLTGTNTGTTTTIDVMDALEKIQSGLDSESYKNLDEVSLTSINLQKTYLLVVQNNIVNIRNKLKDVLGTINVSIIPMNSNRQQGVPLIDAIKGVSDDLNIISSNLNKIPDKKKE